MVTPFWALFSFFSYFFFLPFFCLFSSFLFLSFFVFFCSFLHFLIFSCFSFSFLIFSEEKVSAFLFSCISFKYFFLLASVSEFNCFLRSRCSMEMWCPDDIGRDSWDWVGPPAWGRACFNSPEWGGGSSPVKTEPPQIVLLLLFRTHMKVCVCAQHLKPACNYELIENVQTWRRGPAQKPRELPNPNPDLSRMITSVILITTPPLGIRKRNTG